MTQESVSYSTRKMCYHTSLWIGLVGFHLSVAFTIGPQQNLLMYHNPASTQNSRLLDSSLTDESVLPTLEQLSKDPFRKQVEHGFILTNQLLLSDPQDVQLQELLEAQLSHSDGIRGFMVSYLTADESPADNTEIPNALWGALMTQMVSNTTQHDDLIPLTCMNVIMPTAMITMHTNKEMSASSARTADRGIRILKALWNYEYPTVHENVHAIMMVAAQPSNEEGRIPKPVENSKLIQYWTNFFEKWGYQHEQCRDIVKAMERILR